MARRSRNNPLDADRPRPRVFVTKEAPREAPRGRRRRAQAQDDRRGSRPRPLRFVALTILAALGVVLVFMVLSSSRADMQLRALREQRAAVRQQHEKDVGYYVSMRRQSGYMDSIGKYSQEFEVNTSFLSAIIARESHYDTKAQSHVGARGLMQIMEDTGTWIAGRLGIQGYSYDSLFDPDLNIRFGAWYINYLSAHLDGDPVMIASAYHAGLNNVKLWALSRAADQKRISIDQIPMDNTRDYVQKVMNAYALYYDYDSGNFYRQ